MKKKILSLIAAFLCLSFCFAGCDLGTYIENGNKNPSQGNNTTNPGTDKPSDGKDDPPEDLTTHYRVNVYYGDSLFSPGDNEITVVWRNDENIVRVELDASGNADAGVLEGDYAVYLEGLPSKYTYDCNGYQATDSARYVTILLLDVMEPENATRANGKALYINHGCYSIRYDGTYRAVLDGVGLSVHPASGSDVYYKNGAMIYEYTPTAAGYYSIVSKVNVYDDAINPYIDIYNGTLAYKWFNKTLDGGGASLAGGFTKNFRYEVRIPKAEVGNSFTFAVYAMSKTDEFPVNVDFTIKYEGEYLSSYENVKPVRAEEKPIKAADPKDGEAFVWADLGSKVFEMDNYAYNPSTGRYHYYNMDLYGDNQLGYGKGYGPFLLCAINTALPTYILPDGSRAILYNLNAVLNPGTGANSNYLIIYDVWFEDEQAYGGLDYTNFIRQDYAAVCNNYGYCYVTRELMNFLTLFADNRSLYNDGIIAGTGDEGERSPEQLGYYAEEDAMWLFACGFYYKGGTDALKNDLAKFETEQVKK